MLLNQHAKTQREFNLKVWKRTDNIETTVKLLETTIQRIEAQGFQEPSYNMIFYKEKLLDPLLHVSLYSDQRM